MQTFSYESLKKNMPQPSILVTFDSMKDINCGYFSFGKGLGNALIKENKSRYKFTFYLFAKTIPLFQEAVSTRKLRFFDKLFFTGKNDYDLVHFTDQRVRLNPSMVNAVKIMTIHDMNKVHLKKSKPHRIQAYLDKMRKNISKCDHIVTISQFVANDVIKYFPEAKNKIIVIYNGADKLELKAGHNPAFVPQRPFLFTIGLLSPQKGFHLLPALLQHNDFDLVISGTETPHKQKIIEEAIKYNCLDRVHITGPISDDDKAWYYKNCSAFIFPSKTEGFGLPVIEAMNFGKPVFLSTFTSLPEIGGECAYYFESFEPENIQKVFTDGLIDFNKRRREQEMIDRAKMFTWERAAEAYLNLYEKCMHSRKS
ncbi:glycosyltransferase family 4 protein [Mucilaginibacter auburnensis]|uniref:Glycosyltransferase involved in cell wall biosynthesis n=1 Tax=Mucilaginibacter auburnensis TaxID=1457233 RepID=A0A2H9VS73_9SPHI|nr:glycosyltransferase family 1 protein [Mucilaginibacter auburnensis]PJJ83639.1 glycosyltransferase involved in cell wall biosynthesis [Mucilaginibacter auburnensis]